MAKSPEPKSARNIELVQLRQQGMKYKAIAAQFRISVGRAQQLYTKILKQMIAKHDRGATFEQIGNQWGISADRAETIYKNHTARLARKLLPTKSPVAKE